MSITCPHCGTEYEIEQREMYRYTKCGVCGKGFVAGATTSIQKSDNDEENPPVDHSKMEVPQKPRLTIKRPAEKQNASAQSVIMEDRLRLAINPRQAEIPASAPSGVITAAEERVRMFENMRQKNARTKMLRNFIESAMLLMLLAVVVGLCLWWQSHRNKVAAEAARISAEREAESIRLAAERDRQMRERREKDRIEREAAMAREKAERERRRQEEERQRRMEREARERAEREVRDNKERYDLFLMAIKENDFDLFTKSVTNDMESAGGELCYLFPCEKMPAPLYHVLFETNGTRRVFRIEADGRREETSPETFDEKLDGLEYMVAKGDTVYFRSSRKTPHTGLLNVTKEGDPAETFFGTLAPTLKELKPTYDELTFDIYFTPKGSSKRIFVETLPFGCPWSLQNVKESMEKNMTFSSRIPSGGSSRVRKFKRTVKTYGGAMIKQGVDGITYVPMSPPPERYRETYSSTVPNCIYRSRTRVYTDNSYARWSMLHSKAMQEEAEEAAYYERQRQNRDDRRTSAQIAADQQRQDKIDSALRSGTLSYRIRKAKVKN